MCCGTPVAGALDSGYIVKPNSFIDDIFHGTATVARGKIGEKAPSLPWRVSSVPMPTDICCSLGETGRTDEAAAENEVENGAAKGDRGVSPLIKLFDRRA